MIIAEHMSRATDPDTSNQAAAEMIATGAAQQQRDRVFAVLMETDGLTSDEIAQRSGMQRHQPARRLPEMERLGLVVRGLKRASKVTGRDGITWWIVRQANAATDRPEEKEHAEGTTTSGNTCESQ